MKKTVLTFALIFGLPFFLATSVFALIPPLTFTVSQPAAEKVDYALPYPGILPDHPLYSLKMLRDRIMDFLITDPFKKTEFLILMADKRIGAGKALIEANKAGLGETTISKAENYFNRAMEMLIQARQQGKETNGLSDKLEKSVRKHIEVLQEVLSKAPESARPGLQNALSNAQNGYQRVLELKGGK